MNPPPPQQSQAPGQTTDQHFSKRTLRPAASLPTTAETYGQKFGIDPSVTLALQNVGRKGRQSIAQPTFARTTTAPVISFNSPSPYAQQQGFQNHQQIMDQAYGVINKEKWRSSRNELRPYGSTSTIDDQVSNPGDGDMEAASGSGGGEVQGDRGRKRVQEDDEGTEVDEDEYQDPNSIDNGGDFPEVFNSPNLTQPELFQKQTRFAVPQLPDRAKRGLPARRALGKTVSAPVGRLGMGMDVDGQEGEDGFSIAEWTGKEDF